jgi:NADP-dependent 3-hydroxy acid dehydrogenase YdfG
MAREARPLAGRVVAITGGARGIGMATASALVHKGARVGIGDLDVELARKTAKELGGGTIATDLDVTRRDSFASFLELVEAELGPLDVLVNNAGIMPVGPFFEEDDLSARRQVDINVHGVVYGMKLALPGMVARGSGHIINLASQAGKIGVPGVATYSGTKHFVVGVSEAVRAELDGTGVEISIVMPSIVNTELGSGAKETRGVKIVEPEEVADEIVRALEYPHFDVFVPRWTIAVNKAVYPLPRRWREAIGKAFKVDRVLWEADRSERAAYEARAAHSEPGLEPEEAEGTEPAPEIKTRA